MPTPPSQPPARARRTFVLPGTLAVVAVYAAAAWGRAHPPPPELPPRPPERVSPVLSNTVLSNTALSNTAPALAPADAPAAPELPPLRTDPEAMRLEAALAAAHERLSGAGRDPSHVLDTVAGVRAALGALDRPIAVLRASGEPARVAYANLADAARTRLLRAGITLGDAAGAALDGSRERTLDDPWAASARAVATAGEAVRAVAASR